MNAKKIILCIAIKSNNTMGNLVLFFHSWGVIIWNLEGSTRFNACELVQKREEYSRWSRGHTVLVYLVDTPSYAFSRVGSGGLVREMKEKQKKVRKMTFINHLPLLDRQGMWRVGIAFKMKAVSTLCFVHSSTALFI